VTDWATISSFATAGGTLVLALATFSSVRSANNAARTAERALQVNLRPVLVPSRLEDRIEKVMWVDRHWASVPGGHAVVDLVDENIYLAMSLRNVGSGIAVLHGWRVYAPWRPSEAGHDDPDQFRLQSRDLFIPAGDISFWQGAIRDGSDPDHRSIVEAVGSTDLISVDLLYSDHDGGQRTISRFSLIPKADEGELVWMSSVIRHWNIDRPDPR
jgi:hypothetical protein